MTTNLKKKILVSPELSSSAVGAFFQELGIELNYKYIEGNEYLFVVNSACPDVTHIPRIQTKLNLDSKFAPFVRAYISEELITSPYGKQILSSYFTEGQDLDLVDRYSKDFKNIYTVKIHEFLNVGYFIDSIVVEAYKAKFDIGTLRNYLHSLMNFSFKKVENTVEMMPLDVSYSHNGEVFAIQVSLTVDSFKGKDELGLYLETLSENSNFFDVSYFHKTNKLTFSSVLFKDEKLKNARSYFFTEIAKKTISDSNSELHSGLAPKENISYVATPEIDDQSKKLAIAKKFAFFIKNYRSSEEAAKVSAELEIFDVERYLTFYPRQEAVKIVDEEIKNFILKLIKDDQLYKGIAEYVEKVASSNLDSQVQEIQRVLGGKSLADIEEIIVCGSPQVEGEEKITVKAWSEDGDNEKWEVKKGQINEKIQEEVTRINGNGENIIQDDIIRVISKELDAKEQDVKFVVSKIVEEVVSREMIKNKKLEEALAMRLLSHQSPEQIKEKLESQIGRMKRIMDQLKREIIKLQNEKLSRDHLDMTSVHESKTDSLHMKTALTKATDALKNKERLVEKIKSDAELHLKAKNKIIETLTAKIETLQGEFVKSREFANEEKLERLVVENKTLLSRLEMAKKKVNIMSENIENRDNESHDKLEKEVESLRSSMQIAQSVIERFKQDKIDMEAKLHEEKEQSKKPKDDGSVSRSDLIERETIITALNGEKKALEEKLRAQAIELKKTEQKLKYTTSQLESSNKKKTTTPPGQKSPEAYAKQLEQTKSQLSEANNDVAEKRKELVKLKQENGMMTSRITELEKKLSNLEKKAA